MKTLKTYEDGSKTETYEIGDIVQLIEPYLLYMNSEETMSNNYFGIVTMTDEDKPYDMIKVSFYQGGETTLNYIQHTIPPRGLKLIKSQEINKEEVLDFLQTNGDIWNHKDLVEYVYTPLFKKYGKIHSMFGNKTIDKCFQQAKENVDNKIIYNVKEFKNYENNLKGFIKNIEPFVCEFIGNLQRFYKGSQNDWFILIKEVFSKVESRFALGIIPKHLK